MKRKVTAFIMVVVLLLSMTGVTAFAAEQTKTESIYEAVLSHDIYDKAEDGDLVLKVRPRPRDDSDINKINDYFKLVNVNGTVLEGLYDQQDYYDWDLGWDEVSILTLSESYMKTLDTGTYGLVFEVIVEGMILAHSLQALYPDQYMFTFEVIDSRSDIIDSEDSDSFAIDKADDSGNLNAGWGGSGVTTPVQLPDYYVFSPGDEVTWVPYPSGGRWMFQPSYIDGTFKDGSTATFTALKPGVTYATYFSLEYEKKTIPIYILDSQVETGR